MSLVIKEIKPTKSELKKFAKFSIDLYKGNKYYVPDLIFDTLDTLNPKTNPAFEFCEAIYFMAYRDGKPVGRIAGIINNVVNQRTNSKTARFGFVDFIDDAEVSEALFKAVEDWAHSKQMNQLCGPLGFTDLDCEGMLIEGFEELGTMSTLYNYPYYPEHMAKLGFEKEADWVELKIYVPEEIPEKMVRISDIVARKYELRTIKYTNHKKFVDERGVEIFNLVNIAYDKLFGYSPLTPALIQKYIKMYIPLLRLENVSLIVDKNDDLVALGISMPSMSRALQKSRGRLFPFGWVHLLKALKCKNDIVDLLLVAVKPEYQNKGVNSLLFTDLIPYYQKNGYVWAESNPELESNTKVQSQWQYFKTDQCKRRRAFKKDI